MILGDYAQLEKSHIILQKLADLGCRTGSEQTFAAAAALYLAGTRASGAPTCLPSQKKTLFCYMKSTFRRMVSRLEPTPVYVLLLPTIPTEFRNRFPVLYDHAFREDPVPFPLAVEGLSALANSFPLRSTSRILNEAPTVFPSQPFSLLGHMQGPAGAQIFAQLAQLLQHFAPSASQSTITLLPPRLPPLTPALADRQIPPLSQPPAGSESPLPPPGNQQSPPNPGVSGAVGSDGASPPPDSPQSPKNPGVSVGVGSDGVMVR